MKKERLYDAFGELIYVLAMADGAVQSSEVNTLKEVLANHPWASEIKWSFNYELQKNHDPEAVYQKAMQTFIDHGPDREYVQLLDVMERIAAAFGDVTPEEEEVMLNFQYDFKERIKAELMNEELMTEEDLERINKVTENPISGVSREHLYDAFGEIVFVVAMADGVVQEEEMNALKDIIDGHPWAENIIWSFNYERKKENNPQDIYNKALDTLVKNGPDPEYDNLITLLEEISKASKGMESKEADVIMDFEADLRQRFIEDLEKYKLS